MVRIGGKGMSYIPNGLRGKYKRPQTNFYKTIRENTVEKNQQIILETVKAAHKTLDV